MDILSFKLLWLKGQNDSDCADIYQLYGMNITLKFSRPAICSRLRQENPVKHNYTLEQTTGKTQSVKLETINTQISRCESKQNKFTEQVIFQT